MSENDTQKTTPEPEIEWIETENEEEFRDQIFKMDDRDELLVPVPEWRRKVLVKRLTGTARAEFIIFQINLDKEFTGKPTYWQRLWFETVRLACVHPKTKRPIFRVGDRGTWMDEHDGGVMDMLAQTVLHFSQLDGSAGLQAKKNLLSIGSSTATTNSQNDSGTNA
jgi:hypothetical protein